jgi:hypothetical protein
VDYKNLRERCSWNRREMDLVFQESLIYSCKESCIHGIKVLNDRLIYVVFGIHSMDWESKTEGKESLAKKTFNRFPETIKLSNIFEPLE